MWLLDFKIPLDGQALNMANEQFLKGQSLQKYMLENMCL
ncbi:hypothetical protein AN394_03505 [Pseudoalteromonas sp. P1-26]|nr:hypothetical protein AN213_00205 [Pseudoalteromonas sp. P1-8]KPZ67735.1 hypothetical protein AN394_03505 [Pseudoalteromonas sp. P1-26]